MAKFTKLSFFSKTNILASNFFTQMFSVSILCKQSIRLFQQKLWYKLISLHMHYLCINKMHQELQRALTLTELAPSPYFSNTNVHLVDSNVFAKFDEIPSLPVQDIKEKPKCCGQRITKVNNCNRIGP